MGVVRRGGRGAAKVFFVCFVWATATLRLTGQWVSGLGGSSRQFTASTSVANAGTGWTEKSPGWKRSGKGSCCRGGRD